jgi:predicted Zn-dependent protease
MKKLCLGIILPVLILLAVSFISSCYRNPVTGRSSLSLVDDATVTSLANQQYAAFLSANPPVMGTTNTDMVKRTGSRLATAVHAYLSNVGKSSLVNGYKWEFNLVNNPQANAWCMPGGKVAVYTGILPFTQTEAGLAVVMGHEIGHAVARHGNERMSQMLLQRYGGVALSALLSSQPSATQSVFNTAYGVGSTLGSLAYSRNQEYEADEMGLYFMAMAGYDPSEAVGFWERMAAKGGSGMPEFLSTHPNDRSRIQHIRDLLPKAMQYYRGSVAQKN